MLSDVQKRLLAEIADLHKVPEGAYNIRANGTSAGRSSTANIEITSKEDKPGIDIRIKPGTKNESVHIPVVVSESGLKDVVYNDFFVGDDSDVLIVAGCGINNCGSQDSDHDGVHRFFVGRNARVKYVEKHYGEGDGTGKRILNPTTEVNLGEGSSMEMEMVQIKGVDSTVRLTTAKLEANARLVVRERLMTHATPSSSTATAAARTLCRARSRESRAPSVTARALSAMPRARVTPSATRSSWTRRRSSRCLSWRPTASTRRSSTRPPSARSPGTRS